jgi:hypothetical protein
MTWNPGRDFIPELLMDLLDSFSLPIFETSRVRTILDIS